MEGSLTRVLLVERGALARRSVAVWRELGTETVLAFGTEDAEASWLDDADYAVHHGDAVGAAQAARVVSAAMDAGCDALDPGSLANDVDLLDLAWRANLAVVGCDVQRAARYGEPDRIRQLATELGLPASPASESPEPPSLRRRVDTWVFVDRHGGHVAAGLVEDTVSAAGDQPWLIEHGQVPGASARAALTEASVRVARLVGGPGLLRVRWAWLDETTWALRGLTTSLGAGWPLIHAVHGIDAVAARVRCWLGGAGVQVTLDPPRHGVIGRVLAQSDGAVDRIAAPDDALLEVDAGESTVAGAVLAQVVATAPTRQAALVRLGAELDDVRISGVSTNLDRLRALTGDVELWEGRLDARAAANRIRG